MAQSAPSTLPAYGRDATAYDTQTSSFERYRREIVDELPLRRGDVVIDAGCGTGLCLPSLRERVGPEGTIIGIDAAPDMLAVAADRVAAAGWSNVVLIDAPVEDAELPEQVDHVLFCAVHDVMQSPAALDHVLGRVRPGGGVAAGGGKWGPAWASGSTPACSRCTRPTCATSPGSTGRGRSCPRGCPGCGCARWPWAPGTWPPGGGSPLPPSGSARPARDAPVMMAR